MRAITAGETSETYRQDAAAELVATGTIAAADTCGLQVSTTHVLSSGVAGKIAMAWGLTLSAAICVSGGLFALVLRSRPRDRHSCAADRIPSFG